MAADRKTCGEKKAAAAAAAAAAVAMFRLVLPPPSHGRDLDAALVRPDQFVSAWSVCS